MAGHEIIDRAFASDSNLRKRVFEAIDAVPQSAPLFTDIATFHLDSLSTNGTTDDGGPASKKRKLPNGTSLTISEAQKNQPREVLLEARDISFSLPQRKKLHLGIAQYGTDINNASSTFSIFTRNPTTNEVDMEVPLSQFAYAFRLPVPEKAAKQYNFILLPKPGNNSAEPIIWSVNAGPLKSCTIPNAQLKSIAAGPDDVLESALGFVLRQSNTSLSLPTDEEFSSATPESHRKGDTAYHVKAFRGSKDGYLFFLSNGIFFGFKKPLSFFAFEDVESISYTSVLQRTFNLNIAYRAAGGADGAEAGAVQEVEFSMLDQADFAGIDAYIKRHDLQDASLAASRRAKKLGTQGKADSTQNGTDNSGGGEDDEDDRTELEKAQQQLDDEEDEEEEDYDPGSEGESEGSGYSDDEDDDREYEKERKKMKGKDLVKEELGSEAEDVSVTEDEDEEEDEGDEDDAEQEDEGDEEDEDGDEVEDVNQSATGAKHGSPTVISIPTHGGQWKHEQGEPDPNDEDQL